MNVDEEFEIFMEFPDSLDKRFVTSTSTKLFAKHCVHNYSENLQNRIRKLERALLEIEEMKWGADGDCGAVKIASDALST